MNIHFIEKERLVRPVAPGSLIYKSGNWNVTPEKAKRLVGGTISLHESQADPSYFGGTILDFEVVPDGGPAAGRIVFTFERRQDAIGVRTSKDGWGNEQKTDDDDGAVS